MSTLQALETAGVLQPLDRLLAELLSQDETVQLAAALVSRNLREGHSCLELARVAGTRLVGDDGAPLPQLPSLQEFIGALGASDAVLAVPDLGGAEPETAAPPRPLALDASHRLYFWRYFQHEHRLATGIVRLLGPTASQQAGSQLSDQSSGPTGSPLDRYFPPQKELDLQRRAAELALSQRLLVVSGGPGTGKTATVVRILALLAESALAQGVKPPRVLLVAPTGKAAARLNESIAGPKARLDASPEVKAAIESEASTIHRALGVLPDSRTRFRHNRDNQLPYDLVLVDEASMVNLSLMRHLVEALRPDARLILLGDRYQLASVQAGNVLAELCAALGAEEASSGPSHVVELKKSYRFPEDSGIFAFSQAVRQGHGRAALLLLGSGRDDLVHQPEDVPPARRTELRTLIVEGFRGALTAASASEALAAYNGFRVLCAHRRGAYGVETLNELCRTWLGQAGLVRETGAFYVGRPILVTQNDSAQGLFNGDVGVVWRHPQGSASVYFEGAQGGRWFSPAQLPEHETAFALTIHESQGSEYKQVAIVLPDPSSPLLSRELLYTAVTRAQQRVILSGGEAAIEAACVRSVTRSSGLEHALRKARRAG